MYFWGFLIQAQYNHQFSKGSHPKKLSGHTLRKCKVLLWGEKNLKISDISVLKKTSICT